MIAQNTFFLNITFILNNQNDKFDEAIYERTLVFDYFFIFFKGHLFNFITTIPFFFMVKF